MATTSLGMNLQGVSYWATEYPFIDRFKTSGPWAAFDTDWKYLPSGSIKLDANGYPVALPKGAMNMFTSVNVDPASFATTDRYVLTYKGDASVSVSNSKIISSEPGKIVFEYQSESNFLQLSVSSMDANNPLKDVHIVREDQVGLFNQGEIFNPDFLARADDWTTIRTMDWGSTNNNNIVSWGDRTTLNSASWAYTQSDKASVPLEALVELANKTHTNLWLNIPAMADDDYVRHALEYVRDHLDPSLKLNLEYSNEVWNWVFSQTTYARDMADKLWGNDRDGDGNNDRDSGGGPSIYYGYRSAQIAAISHDVFGASSDARVNNVISTQTVWEGLEKSIFQGVEKANLGSVSQLFDSYAVTTYIGIMPANDADRQTILSWARSGSAGMDKAFHELETGGTMSVKNSLADALGYELYQAKVAQNNGLALVAYEGGLGLDLAGFSGTDLEDVKNFFSRLQADPRMGGIMAKIATDFQSAGGTLLNLFSDTQAITGSFGGVWGLTPSTYETTPGYEALKALSTHPATTPTVTSTPAAPSSTTGTTPAATTSTPVVVPATPVVTQAAPVPAPVVTVPTEISTAAAVYHLGEKDVGVSYTGSADFTGVGNALGNSMTGGKGNDQLYGGDGNDTLLGNDGNDVINGGSGADRMVGGAGDDTYTVDNAGDVVVEAVGGGADTVFSSVTYTLPDNVENLRLTGNGGATATGNALNNWLTGTEGADSFDGKDGNDTVNAGGGNDTLLGGNGNDQLFGGDGKDSINGGAGDDLISGGAGDDTIQGGGGRDILMGDAGADRFVFAPGDLGKTSDNTVQIYGFSHAEGDKIDLSAYDANANTAVNDAFAYVGTAAFSGHAGELRVFSYAGNYVVQGDTNGDRVADFTLNVQSNTALSAADFVL